MSDLPQMPGFDPDAYAEDLFKKCNRLARELADLRDSYDTLAEEASQSQRDWLIERARLELAAGKKVDFAEEHLRDDGYNLAQVLYDRLYHEGFLEGLQVAENASRDLRLNASRKGFRDQNA